MDLFHFLTGKSWKAGKQNGRAFPQQSSTSRGHVTDYTDLPLRPYWDHRYGMQDMKQETHYECDKLTTV